MLTREGERAHYFQILLLVEIEKPFLVGFILRKISQMRTTERKLSTATLSDAAEHLKKLHLDLFKSN